MISWSSLDWDRGRWNQLDLVLGTAFDMGVHMANTYFLGCMISGLSQAVAVSCTIGLYYFVIYNSKYVLTVGFNFIVECRVNFFINKIFRLGAWSHPDNMPDWVKRRIKPLTEEQVQEVKWMDKLQSS